MRKTNFKLVCVALLLMFVVFGGLASATVDINKTHGNSHATLSRGEHNGITHKLVESDTSSVKIATSKTKTLYTETLYTNNASEEVSIPYIASINYTDTMHGISVESSTKIDGIPFEPSYTGILSDNSVSWGSGVTNETSDVIIINNYNSTGKLKGTVILKSQHDISFPLYFPNGEQLVQLSDGTWRVVKDLTNTMNGITIEQPFGTDANGTYIPMHYTYENSELILNVDNTEPIAYPLVIDPTWVATGGYWTWVDGTTTHIMCNATGSVTFVMPSGLIDNTISNIVLVGKGGNGGVGATSIREGYFCSGNGGNGGNAGTVNAVGSYAATGGTPYTLTLGSPASAFGYTAAAGSDGSDGSGDCGNPNGGSGANGYTNGASPYQNASSGSNGGSTVVDGIYYSGGAGGIGGIGWGAGGGGGGGGAYSGGTPGGYGAGEAGLITFTYQNPTTSSIPTPHAQFILNQTGGTAPVTVQFTDKTANATGWSWSYNSYVNGVPSASGTVFSSSQNPVYTFGTAGVNTEYYIYMTALNASSGKFNTTVQNCWINTSALVPSFTTNETNPNLIDGKLTILFTDTTGV